MKINKNDFLREVRDVLFRDFHDCIITDIDKEIEYLKKEDSDRYDQERTKGNIINFDHELLMWMNGMILTWNIIHKEDGSPVRLNHNDFIENFDEVYDYSRRIIPNCCHGYGERCRLHRIL